MLSYSVQNILMAGGATTAVLAYLFLNEKLNRKEWVIIGVVIIAMVSLKLLGI